MSEKNAANAMHQVFISYAGDKGQSPASDIQAAETVCSALEAQGIKCFIAHRDIEPGDRWAVKMIDALKRSQFVVPVVSANSTKSQWVNDEITIALDKGIKIIPFCIEDIEPEGVLELLKVRSQWINAYPKPSKAHLDRLVKAVLSHLGKKIKTETDEIIEVEAEQIADSEPDELEGMPEDVKKMAEKIGAEKVSKNEKDCWQADFRDGIVMVYIPEGEFTMGSDDGSQNEKPPHPVSLDAYWLGKYEVTVGQYRKFIAETEHRSLPSYISKYSPGDNHPVVGVYWDDASAYCDWLSKKTGLSFKLPTEAQWEKGARGNDGRIYPWGNQDPDKNIANFYSNIGKTTPVGSYPAGASPYGLLDMAGNVWEWCSDWHVDDYYRNSPKENPFGPKKSSLRVSRGGSWNSFAGSCRAAYRHSDGPLFRRRVLGFRLAMSL